MRKHLFLKLISVLHEKLTLRQKVSAVVLSITSVWTVCPPLKVKLRTPKECWNTLMKERVEAAFRLTQGSIYGTNPTLVSSGLTLTTLEGRMEAVVSVWAQNNHRAVLRPVPGGASALPPLTRPQRPAAAAMLLISGCCDPHSCWLVSMTALTSSVDGATVGSSWQVFSLLQTHKSFSALKKGTEIDRIPILTWKCK